jgi:mutator protein MutT
MTHSLVRVIAAVVHRGDAMLVCRRPPHKRHGGLWEFPGGKVEPGETDDEAVRRELREELDVEGRATGAAEHEIHDEGSPFLIAFVPVEIEGEPVCHEHTALAWGRPEALAAMALAPSDRRYVEWVLARAAG